MEADRDKIGQLVDELRPFMKQVSVGYEGELNAQGRPNGWGVRTDKKGNVYSGEWRDGQRCGHGLYTFKVL